MTLVVVGLGGHSDGTPCESGTGVSARSEMIVVCVFVLVYV